jgi:flagellar assembly protein FliH
MNLSCNPPLKAAIEPQTQAFPYAEVVLANDLAGPAPVRPLDVSGELVRRESAVREQARQEGERQARAEYQAQLGRLREDMTKALAEFERQRAAYYQQVEVEVVQLALSMARKILHREAQTDPLLLAGLVHVALRQIEGGTKVTVRANPLQASELRSYFAQHLEPTNMPEVIEDPGVERECCVLQTSLGKTELGLEVQLKEIEQGLLDLVARRPPGNS